MIDELRSLDATQQKRLIALLEPDRDVLSLQDDDTAHVLAQVLRDGLGVPSDRHGRRSDLGEYLRRRVVEVARDDFNIGDDFDMITDTEIAILILRYVIVAAAVLADDDQHLPDFEKFFRTKNHRQRVQWLTMAAEMAATAKGESFDRAESEARISDYSVAQAARGLLGDLGSLSPDQAHDASPNWEWATDAPRDVGVTGKPYLKAGALSALLLAGAVSAMPMAAAAGGMFMAGLRRSRDADGLESVVGSSAERAKRSRRSRLVQTVVILAAFVVAEADMGASSLPPRA